MNLFSIFNILNKILFFKIFQIPFVVLILLSLGLYFSIKLRFIAQRNFLKSFKLIFKSDDENSGIITIIQSLLTSLTSSVGMGNVVGVTYAILIGGPGAIFWMLFIAFLSMNTSFAENLLATTYRKINKKEKKIDCAPIVYIKESLKKIDYVKLGKILSLMYAILYIIGITGTNIVQNRSSTDVILSNFSFLTNYRILISVLITIFSLLFSIKGISIVVKVAPKIMSFASSLYLFFGLIIIIININKLPIVLYSIIKEAFNFKSAFGGFFAMMSIGFQRGTYSNESGLGTTTIAHAASKNNNNIEEALLGSLNPFLDTIVICFITALIVLISGEYNIGGTNNIEAIDLIQNCFSSLNYYCKYIIFIFIICVVFSYSILSLFNINNVLRTLIKEKYLFIFYILEVLLISISAFLKSFDDVVLVSDTIFFSILIPNAICLFLNGKNISNMIKKYNK